MTTFCTLGPNRATIPIERRMSGKASMTSRRRMMISSMTPLKKLASMPRRSPIPPPRTVAANPTMSEMRPPKSTRVKTSRPNLSVPIR
jgi:hypothetical protein